MRTTLCPGYSQVDEFADDDAYESGEEVEYLTLDLGNIEPTLVPSSATYRLIGLDTPTPFLQLSGTVLRGKHEELLGTELIFIDDTEPTERGKKSVAHVCNTSKRISFKEVRLRSKDQRQEYHQLERSNGNEDEDGGLEYANPDPTVGATGEDFDAEYANIGPEASSSSAPRLPFTEHSITPSGADYTLSARPGAVEDEEPVDPAMLIDHLTGISHLHPRAVRADPNNEVISGKKPTKRDKGKGKQKAPPEEMEGLDDGMDVTEE